MTTWAFRVCRKKVEHKNKRKAKKKADFYGKHGHKLKPYECEICKKWHLTKKK